MAARKTYTVTAEREDDWWILRFPDLRGATQARRLDTADRIAKDYIYGLTDEPVDSFDINIAAKIGERLLGILEEAESAQEYATDAQNRATTLRSSAALGLQEIGLSVRDIGDLMKISYQRAAQILASAD